MASITKTLRVLADPNRLRILLLLKGEELSVAELQEILAMGQSTISTHLSQLKQAELVEDRRTGKSNLYRLATQFLTSDGLQHPEVLKEHDFGPADPGSLQGHDSRRAESGRKPAGALAPEGSFLNELLARAGAEIPEAAADQAAMRRVLKKRQDKTRAFFDSVAGRMGKDYVPGKSWKSLAEALLRLMPPMVIADMGAGEGAFALLLAQRARKVIAVDSSARMIEVGRDQAQRAGIKNIEYRLGDMEEIPIGPGEVDVVFFSQSLHHALHPERALAETARVLAPGGRVVVLDLLKHRFEEARELYADEWLGFSEAELESMLASAGFANIETAVVDKEPEPPQFQTLLAVGAKAV
jgi:ubiquinone/menaquinone biosynthesis C-methylase UbiE/DNA-binding transcriptional ArsR family regulator